MVAKFTLKQRETFEAAALELRKVEHFRAPRDTRVMMTILVSYRAGGVLVREQQKLRKKTKKETHPTKII